MDIHDRHIHIQYHTITYGICRSNALDTADNTPLWTGHRKSGNKYSIVGSMYNRCDNEQKISENKRSNENSRIHARRNVFRNTNVHNGRRKHTHTDIRSDNRTRSTQKHTFQTVQRENTRLHSDTDTHRSRSNTWNVRFRRVAVGNIPCKHISRQKRISCKCIGSMEHTEHRTHVCGHKKRTVYNGSCIPFNTVNHTDNHSNVHRKQNTQKDKSKNIQQPHLRTAIGSGSDDNNIKTNGYRKNKRYLFFYFNNNKTSKK